ncbi:hypothetical protein BAE44_0000488, partial [Dichanthelium oligosanthes]
LRLLPVHCFMQLLQICHYCRLLPLTAAGDHNTETRCPWGKKKAAMRKGAPVGAGLLSERRPASDPRPPGATPLPAPPRRVGLQALGRATGLRRRGLGLGLGTVGSGCAAGSGRGLFGQRGI